MNGASGGVERELDGEKAAAATRKNDETKGKRLYFFINDEKQRHRDDEESRTRPLPLQLLPPTHNRPQRDYSEHASVRESSVQL